MISTIISPEKSYPNIIFFFSEEDLLVLQVILSSRYPLLQVFYQLFGSMHLPLKLSKDKRLAATWA